MGTWGSGNFDSDDALEILEEVVSVIHPEIDGLLQSSRVGYEDLSAILACVAVENALVQHCNLKPRDRESASALNEKILAIFDAEAEEMINSPDFLTRRRDEIEHTLEKMLIASQAHE